MTRPFRIALAGCAIAVACLPSPGPLLAQGDLDRQAWNYVWDRFEDVLGGTSHGKLGPDEIVNILKFPVPLASGDSAFDSQSQLQNIAGVIPKRSFALDVSDQDVRLHNEYRRILANLRAPQVSDEKQARIDAAAGAYDTAFKDFDKSRSAWSDRIIAELKKLEVIGHKPNDKDYFRVRDATSSLAVAARSKMMAALIRWKNEVPSDWVLSEALLELELATAGKDDALSNGIVKYELNEDVNFKTASCSDTGWYDLGLSKSTKSQAVRTDNWTAGGGWGGEFVKLGSEFKGGDFSNTVQTDSQSIKLRFCNMRFIPVTASWFHMDLLRDIDRGIYELKADSRLSNQKMLGPTGLIPRIVKGLIVARDIKLEARLDKTRIDEMRKTFSYGGGFSIGPFNFGGSASRVEYNITESGDSGFFGLSSSYGRPIVLAVVLQETQSPARIDKKPGANQ